MHLKKKRKFSIKRSYYKLVGDRWAMELMSPPGGEHITNIAFIKMYCGGGRSCGPSLGYCSTQLPPKSLANRPKWPSFWCFLLTTDNNGQNWCFLSTLGYFGSFNICISSIACLGFDCQLLILRVSAWQSKICRFCVCFFLAYLHPPPPLCGARVCV